jgi:hypothetical protein
MGGEHHRPAVGNLVQFVDEDRALFLQGFDDEAVVDDLMADIDRGSIQVDGAFHHMDGAVDTGAESTGTGQDDGKGRLV